MSQTVQTLEHRVNKVEFTFGGGDEETRRETNPQDDEGGALKRHLCCVVLLKTFSPALDRPRLVVQIFGKVRFFLLWERERRRHLSIKEQLLRIKTRRASGLNI